MLFAKELRERIRRGRIRCTVRVWTGPRVKVGGRYAMDKGHVVVDSIARIRMRDITYDLARESGFDSVDDLLRMAKARTQNTRTAFQLVVVLEETLHNVPAPEIFIAATTMSSTRSCRWSRQVGVLRPITWQARRRTRVMRVAQPPHRYALRDGAYRFFTTTAPRFGHARILGI
jgi:hypothetical protein